MNAQKTATKTTLSVAVVKTLLDTNGKQLNVAQRQLKRFNIEVSAAKILRKMISENLAVLNEQIRTGKAGHKNKALVAARAFLVAQYQELLGDKMQYKFTRTQIQQFIDGQSELVLGLDDLWEEKKAAEPVATEEAAA